MNHRAFVGSARADDLFCFWRFSYTAALLQRAGVTDASAVTVVIGNGPNICVEWGCYEPGKSINISQMAAEWAGYTEDVLKALSPLGVALAASPLAPGGNARCGCCTPAGGYFNEYCKGSASGGSSTSGYLALALAARPGLFSRATHFAAHPYPSNEWSTQSVPAMNQVPTQFHHLGVNVSFLIVHDLLLK